MSKAYIIGAGPGDEGLLTLKAVKVMKECTAVLYDRLIGNNVLSYLNEDCEVYFCGKEPGCHYKTQDEINAMLVELAKKGHTVGRIKGGDPYVFGRGGEEVLALEEENIPFEVIPGVTSAVAVMSYAGIPITHRGLSQGFHVLTGMSAATLNIQWEVLTKSQNTIVFLMGLENLGDIVKNLVENGKPKDTPCGVIMRGTTAKQKKVIGTLENIEELVKNNGLKSPSIIVVGKVVTLNDKLNWFEKLPLFGANVCVTRTKEQAGSMKAKLRSFGAEVTEIPAIKIVNTSDNLNTYKDEFDSFDYIILTSVNGVNIFFDYLKDNNIDVRKIKAEFAVIGKATLKALSERGIVASVMADEFVAEGLVKQLESHELKSKKVLMPISKNSRNLVGEFLKEQDAEVYRIHTYETQKADFRNLNAFDSVNTIIFTSPSTVNNLIEAVGIDKVKDKLCIAIGPITYKALKDKAVDAVLSEVHSEDGAIDKLIKVWGDRNV
ncbi:uroporphyrinogen-III C-methyltransferase [Clostridium manihotivorum]|uniref:uroporphyrinogen-III C-methyltransferase n=1 Tax=Clostridium manihotivorum TaxID=2320868 RepID=A0A410DYL2_9CLOT|nr:uroporphyrinogen-III C-methyltransferase [Clostridium manihotivorum]QAA34149.1 uroporphyrinogen-III C-methyltransferase [Clostridium manihotivorum]